MNFRDTAAMPADRPARHGRALAGACAAAAWLLSAVSALAASATVHGAEMAGYGRAVFEFDSLPRAMVRVGNGVLIVSFDKRVTFAPEKLAGELPSYVSAVRVDPDGKAIRFALQRPIRPNLMEAGEKLFLDLLPDGWKGAPPALPQEVVDALSRRARQAEETARLLARKRAAEEVRELPFRIGTTPTFTRILFQMPVVAAVEMKREGERVSLVFEAPLRIDAARLRAALPSHVVSVEAEPLPGALKVSIAVPPELDVRGFREDENYAIDIAAPRRSEPPRKEAAKETAKEAARETARKQAPPKDLPAGAVSGPAAGDPPAPAAAGRDAPEAARPAEVGRDPAPPGQPGTAQAQPAPIAPVDRAPPPFEAAAMPAPPDVRIPVIATVERGTARLALGLPAATPLAVFERAGTLWIAAETPAAFDPGQIGLGAPGIVAAAGTSRVGRLSILRLDLARTGLVRASATPGGWVVTIGDEVAAPSDLLGLVRGVDDAGRVVMRSPFKDVGGVHWVEDPVAGDRLAIVTGRNVARSVVKGQGFVDFRVLPTAQGLVIAPVAEDVSVKSGLDEVTISRDGGLFVSLIDAPPARPDAAAPALVAERGPWSQSRAGNVRVRDRMLARTAADAPKNARGQARLAYARFQVANRLAPEALGTLAVAVADEPGLAHDRTATLLTGMAQLLGRRLEEAGRTLGADAVKDDPEGVLWQAYLDAQQGRWQKALVGFRRSERVLAAYPEDLQQLLGPAYAEAALEARDYGLARQVLDAIDWTGSEPGDRQEASFLAARVAEGLGQTDEALSAYAGLAEKAVRPVQAKARLAHAELGLKMKGVERRDALAELEGAAVTWRGDAVEARCLALLGRLYAEEERWRDAFSMARRANELFPDAETTRALYDETGSRFEELFLDNKADRIPRLDAIALYFDFKEFTPPGRRGDEMIRRLAERLLALDLLPEAADLLQYQVQNRLGGAAKASVATRLAVIQLMNRQPAKAYQALKDSRLAELPADLKRARALLEARALSDLSRTDLALEMLDGEQGADVDRLRTDILWQSRRWRDAGEAYERILGDAWEDAAAPLDHRARTDVLRAAIAYALSEERLSLDRLRAKFAAKMSDSADAKMFAVLTSPDGALSPEFREAARTVTNADTLGEFLGEFRKRYPDTPQPPLRDPDAAGRAPASEQPKPGADAAGMPQQPAAQPAPSPAGREEEGAGAGPAASTAEPGAQPPV